MVDGYQAHLAAASLNQTVGDWAGNERRIREVIAEARDAGCPAPAPARDVRLRATAWAIACSGTGTVERSWDRLCAWRTTRRAWPIAAGLPILFEGVLVQRDGPAGRREARRSGGEGEPGRSATWSTRTATSALAARPSGRVSRARRRHRAAGNADVRAAGAGHRRVRDLRGCLEGDPAGLDLRAGRGPRSCMNPSASWFTIGKHRTRRRMVEQISREDHCVYLYASLLGLRRDPSDLRRQPVPRDERPDAGRGASVRVHARLGADPPGRGPLGIRHVRMEEGSWRDQIGAGAGWRFRHGPRLVRVPGEYSTTDLESPAAPALLDSARAAPPRPVAPLPGSHGAGRPGDHRARPEPPGAGAGPGPGPPRLRPQVRDQGPLPGPLRAAATARWWR